MSQGHSHSEGSNERAIKIALGLTTAFLVAEFVGGIVANSLALISDAAHMLTDSAALAIALLAIRIGRRAADSKRTFGYYRFEILAAAFNAGMLFAVAIYIVFEAWRRLSQPPEVQSTMMLVIAALGLVVNLISMKILSGDRDSSLNVKGAYLEVWSDMLGSVGVIIGGLVIRFTGWAWVDTVVAVGIGVWVLPRTWVLLKESFNILLEGVPDGVELDAIKESITSIPGVASIHDLHVWGITKSKVSLTTHVVCSDGISDVCAIQKSVCSVLAERFDIEHVTIQVEREPCHLATDDHTFGGPKESEEDDHAGHSHAGHNH